MILNRVAIHTISLFYVFNNMAETSSISNLRCAIRQIEKYNGIVLQNGIYLTSYSKETGTNYFLDELTDTPSRMHDTPLRPF